MQVPNPSAPATQTFIKTLLAQPIRPPNGVPPGSCKSHHQPQVVSSVVTPYPEDECWFNCVEYAIANGGVPVFGWAIWSVGTQKYVAQHHAVVDVGSSLVDVTLGRSFPAIMFVPDNNAPFDFSQLRFPFSFEVSAAGMEWFAVGHTSPVFAIALASGTDRASRVIEAGRLAGVI